MKYLPKFGIDMRHEGLLAFGCGFLFNKLLYALWIAFFGEAIGKFYAFPVQLPAFYGPAIGVLPRQTGDKSRVIQQGDRVVLLELRLNRMDKN